MIDPIKVPSRSHQGREPIITTIAAIIAIIPIPDVISAKSNI